MLVVAGMEFLLLAVACLVLCFAVQMNALSRLGTRLVTLSHLI